MSFDMTLERFQALVGEPFEVEIGEDIYPATLEEASRARGDAQGPERVSFSLLFSVSGIESPSQGTYRVLNEQLGEAKMFLVPIGQADDHVRFEAIFN